MTCLGCEADAAFDDVVCPLRAGSAYDDGFAVEDARQGAGIDGEWSLPWRVQRGEGPLFGLSWISCQGVQGGSASAHLRVGMKGVGETPFLGLKAP